MKRIFLFMVLLGFGVGQVSAEVLGTGTNLKPEYGDPPKFLKINGNSKTVWFYTKKKRDKVAIAFNAECAVKKGKGWVDISVYVNGRAQRPSKSDNAFCSGIRGDWKWKHRISAVTNVVFRSTKKGWNRVNVYADMKGAGKWRIDDKSVIVWN